MVLLATAWCLSIHSNSANAATTLYFDFGGALTSNGTGPANDPVNYWNNVTSAIGTNSSGSLSNLVTSTNQATTMGLQMISRFTSANTNGTTASTLFPSNATSDSLFGNTGNHEGFTNIFPSFKITGLSTSSSYDFLFFASRTGVNDNRETAYTVTGAGPASTVHLNAANNINNTISLTGVAPNAQGEITITLGPGPNNTNAVKYTYLGVMSMTVASVPEPSRALLVAGALAALILRRRQRL